MNILFLIKDPYLNERFGVMYLSAVAKKEGHYTRIIDPSTDDFNKLMGEVKAFKPDILAYSTETGPHAYYLELNMKIRSQICALSIMGGPHPTFFPEVIFEDDSLDGVCIGEGELAFKELLARLSAKDDYLKTNNFWFKDKQGNVIKNNLFDLIPDLDMLPFPDRDIFSNYKSRYSNPGEWSFLIGRGCPHGCTYCFNHSYNSMYKGKGQIIRKRSVENIIEEIKIVQKSHEIKFVTFIDDNFVLGSKEWLVEFAEKYPAEVGIPFRIAINPSTVNEAILKILKNSGCFSVSIGVEAGNEEVRRKVLGRNISNNKIIEVCKMLKKHGIKILTQNILGLPIEKPYEHDLETLRLNQLCKPDFAWASIFYPFPKTVLGEFSFSNSYVDCNLISSVRSYMLKSALNYKSGKEKMQIENLHKFFGIAIEYPFLTPIVKALIKLPLHKAYVYLFFMWYGFCDKYKMQNERLTIKNVFKHISSLFTYLNGLLAAPLTVKNNKSMADLSHEDKEKEGNP